MPLIVREEVVAVNAVGTNVILYVPVYCENAAPLGELRAYRWGPSAVMADNHPDLARGLARVAGHLAADRRRHRARLGEIRAVLHRGKSTPQVG